MAYAINAIAGRLHDAIAGLRKREEGQGLVEYVVLIALIALGLFVAITFFRDELGDIFSEITNKIGDELPG